MGSFIERTMLIERVFGVGTYCLLLAFFYFRLKKAATHKEVSNHLGWYCVFLTLLGFIFIPAASTDISRWRAIAEGWTGYSLIEFISKRVLSSDTPVGYLLIFICEKTGIDGLLPGVCAFVFFLNAFHIFKKTAENNTTSASIARALLFFMSSGAFVEVISGIRCFLAFSIVSRCIFDEIVCKKSIFKSIVPYLIAVLMHTAVLPLIAIRIFVLFLETKLSTKAKVWNIVFLFVIGIIVIRYGGGYLSASLIKAGNFIFDSETHYSNMWEYLIGGLQYLTIVATIVRYQKHYKTIVPEYDNLVKMLIALAIVEGCLVISYSIFHRFLVVSSFLAVPVIAFVIDRERRSKESIYSNNIVIVSLIMLIIACTRGNLCAYKYFLLD